MPARSDRSPHGGLAKPRTVLATAFVIGVILYGYGAGALLGVFPGTGFVIGAFVYVGMAIGAILVSQIGLVTVRLWLEDRSQPLPGIHIATIAVTAPFFAAVAMSFAWSWSVHMLSYNLTFLAWTFLGQLALSLQVFVGTVQPERRRRTVLAVETFAVAGSIAVLLLMSDAIVGPGGLLFLSGGGAVAFLLFGGLFYLLGRSLRGVTTGTTPRRSRHL